MRIVDVFKYEISKYERFKRYVDKMAKRLKMKKISEDKLERVCPPLMLYLGMKNYNLDFFDGRRGKEKLLGALVDENSKGEKKVILGKVTKDAHSKNVDFVWDEGGVYVRFKKDYKFESLPMGFYYDGDDWTSFKREFETSIGSLEWESELWEIYLDLLSWIEDIDINYNMDNKRFICTACHREGNMDTKRCKCGGVDFIYGDLRIIKNEVGCKCGGIGFTGYMSSESKDCSIVMMFCNRCGDEEFGSIYYGGDR